jgi:predicted nucleic acid-binding protein
LKYLLDTNAVSEPQKPRPDGGYMRWIAEREPAELAITVLTYSELTRGIISLDPGRRRAELTEWLAEALTFFSDRVLQIDLDVAATWAEVWVKHRKLGRGVGVVDELTAASAITHGLVVVTRNVSDFEHSGCELLNPWSS